MRRLRAILSWPLFAYYRFLRSGGGLATHVKILPFGSGFTTYLVAKFIGHGEWLFWRDWDAMTQAASLGLIGYSFGMATLEVVIMVGILAAEYIIGKHKKIRQEGLEAGRKVERKEWQAWYERQVANGVTMPEPPPMSNGAHPEDSDAG